MAGWLVTRTGGLEAGIALHVVNNIVAFGLALAVGDVSSTLTVSEVSWWNIVVTVTQSGVYILLVLWLARRMQLQTSTRPPYDEPAGASGPAVAAA
jgi:membrane protease YdiL (CAAX protease family)